MKWLLPLLGPKVSDKILNLKFSDQGLKIMDAHDL